MNFLGRGLPNRGRVIALELQERGRRLGDPRAAATGLWILGWLDIIDERYEDALVHGNEFAGATYYRARIDADLGILHKLSKRRDQARSHLMQARPVAESLGATGLLSKIDTALADLR